MRKRLCNGFKAIVDTVIKKSPTQKPLKVEKPIFNPRQKTVRELMDLREQMEKEVNSHN